MNRTRRPNRREKETVETQKPLKEPRPDGTAHREIFPFALLVVVILIFLLSLEGCDHAPQRYLAMAEERWNQGDYLGAAREYERIIHEYPKSGPAAEAY